MRRENMLAILPEGAGAPDVCIFGVCTGPQNATPNVRPRDECII